MECDDREREGEHSQDAAPREVAHDAPMPNPTLASEIRRSFRVLREQVSGDLWEGSPRISENLWNLDSQIPLGGFGIPGGVPADSPGMNTE
eukprot:154939-Amorphochlora_amoeboformis.AAC.2